MRMFLKFCTAALLGLSVLTLSACRSAPYPDKPIPEAEAGIYEGLLLGMYEGMSIGEVRKLAERRPLFTAQRDNTEEMIFAFRSAAPVAGQPAKPGTSYLRVVVDRTTETVVSWTPEG